MNETERLNIIRTMSSQGYTIDEIAEFIKLSTPAKPKTEPQITRTRVNFPNFERFLLALYDASAAGDWGNGKPNETEMKKLVKRTHLTKSRAVANEKYGEFARLLLDALLIADNSEELKCWLAESITEGDEK